MHAAMKKARGGFARAFIAVLANNEFVEDSVTRSQGFSCSRADKTRSLCKQQEKNTESSARCAAIRASEATLNRLSGLGHGTPARFAHCFRAPEEDCP
jgi:hypothetical protein